jgi:hypothetical protein
MVVARVRKVPREHYKAVERGRAGQGRTEELGGAGGRETGWLTSRAFPLENPQDSRSSFLLFPHRLLGCPWPHVSPQPGESRLEVVLAYGEAVEL